MHGGKMYIRGKVKNPADDVEVTDPDEDDIQLLRSLVGEYCSHFDSDIHTIMAQGFSKLVPVSKRPYGKLYAA
jgi:glutamate synthase domain-containing protein 3